MDELLAELQRIVAPRIRRVSRVVKLVAYALSWIGVILCAGAGLMVVLPSTRAVLPLSLVLFSLVQGALWIAILRQVAKLTELYEQGKLFTPDNVRRIRAIGLLCMPFCIGVGLVATDEGFVSELDFSPSAVFLGAVLVFVSWIMDEARRLHEPD